MTSWRLLAGLIAGTTLVRLISAASLGLGPDEAYYAQYLSHLDWSYHDHPPMLALLLFAGNWLLGGVVTPELALRSVFLVGFAVAMVLMSRLASRSFGSRAGLLSVVILNGAAYYGAAAGTFALPDGPLLVFWLATIDRLLATLEQPDRTRPWIAVGLAWGGAMLTKYHAVFLPAGFLLFAAIDRRGRESLRTAGPYLAVLIGLLLFSPVILWNAAHGWCSFAFQADRAVGRTGFRPEFLAAFLGGQAAYLTPWLWIWLGAAAWRRRGSLVHTDGSAAERLLLCQAAVPLAAFLAVACVRPVLPHWSLVGFVPLMPLLGADWAVWFESRPGRVRRRAVIVAAVPLVGLALFTLQARTGLLQRGGKGTIPLLAAELDPSVALWGWDQIADELRERGLLDRPDTFLFTSRWYESGQLAFALKGASPVLCYNPTTPHGFAQWSRPEDWLGRDGVLALVHRNSTEPQVFDRYFARVEPLGAFDVRRAGGVVRHVRLYLFHDQIEPFPFDGR